ncbi:MAG: hypothetical protein LC798_08715 [Chloroflexi bacterium]|nr:hypothetical protein [Chloroflexota bacterium]
MHVVVTGTALALSVASFVAFLVFGWQLRRGGEVVRTEGLGQGLGGQAEQQGLKESIEAIAKLVEAISKLADSLARAGPAIASLVASLLFFAFALVSLNGP